MHCKVGGRPIESLLVKVKGENVKDDVMVSVCYRSASHEEVFDKAFFKQLTEVTRSQDLVLMGYFTMASIGMITQQSTDNPAAL